MNRPVVEVRLSGFESMMRRLAPAAAKRPPITNAREVEHVLLDFGTWSWDMHMQRDVIRFDSLERCNAARAAMCGNADNAFPTGGSPAQEVIAFIMDDVLVWMAFGTTRNGNRCHYVNLMYGDDIAGLRKDVA